MLATSRPSAVLRSARTRPKYLSGDGPDTSHGPLGNKIFKPTPRGLGALVFRGAPGVEFGRVDAAQPHAGPDFLPEPDMHANLDRVPVDDTQHVRPVCARQGGVPRPDVSQRRGLGRALLCA